jgi:L-fuconolactonase
MVINHFAKPDLNKPVMKQWSQQMKDISNYHNVYVKMSGLLTQTKEINTTHIEDYFSYYIEYFGKRVMWGSDWPVLTLNGKYETWLSLCANYILKHYKNLVDDIFHDTACKVYNIKY